MDLLCQLVSQNGTMSANIVINIMRNKILPWKSKLYGTKMHGLKHPETSEIIIIYSFGFKGLLLQEAYLKNHIFFLAFQDIITFSF